MNLCIKCNKNPAISHSVYGFLPCKTCSKSSKLQTPYEFTSQNIKEERKKYANDIMSSSRGGVLNSRYINKYGTEGLNVTQEQVKGARDVYAGEISSLPYKENDGRVI